MLGFLGVLGGAAYLEIRKLRGKGDHNQKEELEKLQEKEKELESILESLSHELAAEKKLNDAVGTRLIEALRDQEILLEEAENLKQVKAHAEERSAKAMEEKEKLSSHNTVLFMENVLLQNVNAKLKGRTQALLEEKEQLTAEVESLRLGNSSAALQHEEELRALKAQVSGLISKFLSHDISEVDVAKELEELGCEVTLLPAEQVEASSSHQAAQLPQPAPDAGTFLLDTPTMVLEEPERLQRLVAACMNVPLGDSDNSIPLMSFSSMRDRLDGTASRLGLSWRRREVDTGKGLEATGEHQEGHGNGLDCPPAPSSSIEASHSAKDLCDTKGKAPKIMGPQEEGQVAAGKKPGRSWSWRPQLGTHPGGKTSSGPQVLRGELLGDEQLHDKLDKSVVPR